MRSVVRRCGRAAGMLALAAGGIGAAAWFPLVTPRAAPREVALVARDMTFYLEGETAANPVLRLEPGEEVRFVLRNADPGFKHWLEIEALDVRIGPLDSSESGVALVRVPDTTGRFDYVCSPHAAMMRGSVEVAGSQRAGR